MSSFGVVVAAQVDVEESFIWPGLACFEQFGDGGVGIRGSAEGQSAVADGVGLLHDVDELTGVEDVVLMQRPL